MTGGNTYTILSEHCMSTPVDNGMENVHTLVPGCTVPGPGTGTCSCISIRPVSVPGPSI
jgi:hypothetical protein